MSTEVGKVNGMPVHAGTAAGAAYVNKVTHPPSPMTSEYQGRPDCSAPNVVLMELKSEVNVPPILTFPSSATQTKTVNPSSILFLQSSGAVVANYVFFWLADAASRWSGWVQPQGQSVITGTGAQPGVNQVAPVATRNAGYNFNSWQRDVASHRKTYKSSTYYLNATNFNNQGIVTSGKFKPDIVQGNTLTQLFESHAGCKESFRNLLAAVKASIGERGLVFNSRKKDSSDKWSPDKDYRVDDDEFCVVDKEGVRMPAEQMQYQILEMGTYDNTVGGNLDFSNNMYWNTLFPENSSELMVSSPKAATRPAREGAFVVAQQEDEVIPWVGNYSTTQNAAMPPALNLSFMRYLVGNINYYIPLYATDTRSNTFSPYTAEVPWSSLDWSYTLFEGLTVPSQVGTTLTSVPYITVKSFTGLEIQPRIESSLVTFQRTLPLPDADAIRMAVGIMHARPDSLPAAANDLGSIAMTAMKFIPTAVSWLKDIFGGKKEKAEKKKPTKQKTAKRGPKLSRVAVASRRSKEAVLEAKINKLTAAVNNMGVQASKAVEPATSLPKYENQAAAPLPRRNRKVRGTPPGVDPPRGRFRPQPGMSLRQYLATERR